MFSSLKYLTYHLFMLGLLLTAYNNSAYTVVYVWHFKTPVKLRIEIKANNRLDSVMIILSDSRFAIAPNKFYGKQHFNTYKSV